MSWNSMTFIFQTKTKSSLTDTSVLQGQRAVGFKLGCPGTSGLRGHRVFVYLRERARSASQQGRGPTKGEGMGSQHS